MAVRAQGRRNHQHRPRHKKPTTAMAAIAAALRQPDASEQAGRSRRRRTSITNNETICPTLSLPARLSVTALPAAKYEPQAYRRRQRRQRHGACRETGPPV
jgi:hypothetical protein